SGPPLEVTLPSKHELLGEIHLDAAHTTRKGRSTRRLTEEYLFRRGNQLFDSDCVWPQLLREPRQIRIRDLDESRLVHVCDHLDAHRLQLDLRLVLELERLARLRAVDLGRRREDPLLLLGR